ncbi:hypothetical protein KCW65_21440, partial [Mycobacterium tuberculosis]|nr:hypothetical protein [Mycobacterium tuberculosis]
ADHLVVEQALSALRKLEHRGGIASDEGTGDGAGITLQIPHDYFAEVLAADGITLPEAGEYAVGIGFFSQDYRRDLTGGPMAESDADFPTAGHEPLADEEALVRRIAAEEGLTVLAIRDVPRDESVLGDIAR